MKQRSALPIQIIRLFAVALLALTALAPSLTATAVASPAAAKPKVTIFYSAATAAYTKWVASTSTARPAKTIAFPANASTIAFYFEYANAIPKATKLQIIVYTDMGNGADRAEARIAPFAVTYKNGMAMRKVSEKGGFQGPYKAVLLIDGHPSLSTTFSVRIDGGE